MRKHKFLGSDLEAVANSLDSKGAYDLADEVDKVAFIGSVVKNIGQGVAKGVGAVGRGLVDMGKRKLYFMLNPELKKLYDQAQAQLKAMQQATTAMDAARAAKLNAQLNQTLVQLEQAKKNTDVLQQKQQAQTPQQTQNLESTKMEYAPTGRAAASEDNYYMRKVANLLSKADTQADQNKMWMVIKQSPSLKAMYDRVNVKARDMAKFIREMKTPQIAKELPLFNQMLKQLDDGVRKGMTQQKALEQQQAKQVQAPSTINPAASIPTVPSLAILQSYMDKVSELAFRLQKSGFVGEAQAVHHFQKKFLKSL